MSLTFNEMREMHDRLCIAEAVPVPRVVREALADARRLYAEMPLVGITEIPQMNAADMLARQEAIVAYSSEHGAPATGAKFGISTSRVYQIRHRVKQRSRA